MCQSNRPVYCYLNLTDKAFNLCVSLFSDVLFQNLGNTCFLTAVVQVLLSNSDLKRDVNSHICDTRKYYFSLCYLCSF